MKRENIKEGTYVTNIVDQGCLQVLRFKKTYDEYAFDICESVTLIKDLKGAEINVCKEDYFYSAAIEETSAKRSTANEIFFLTIYQLKYKKNCCEKILFD